MSKTVVYTCINVSYQHSFPHYVENFGIDFINDYKQYESKFIHVPNYHFVNSAGKQVKGSSAGISLDSSLEDDEIHLNYATYNSYFGGKFNTKNLDTFKGDTFAVAIYDTKSNAIISKEFKVTKLYVKVMFFDI